MKYFFALAALCAVLAWPAAAQAQAQYPGGYYGGAQGWRGTLSAKDQEKFDKYYNNWVEATRKGDQDDIQGNARHMQEIMGRYNIPLNVPFDALASNPVTGGYGQYPGAYPGYGQSRLSPDDQRNFDKAYSKWLDAQRKGDQEDMGENVRKMQEIMARNNIPPNVPFAAIASNGYAAAPGGYPQAYPNGGYAYGQAGPLSSKDQKDFDKAYRNWVSARQRRDMDDVDKNAHKMEDIMARYNIPANVAFDRIASPGAAYQH